MKKTFTLLLIITNTLSAQINFEALKLSNNYPQASQKLSFTFNKELSSLKSEKNIFIEIYEFNSDNKIVKDPKLQKKGNLYSGSFTIDSNTHVIAFYIIGDTKDDNNFGNGYFVPIYINKELIKPYFKTRAEIYSFYGGYNFNLENSYQKGLDLLEEGLRKYPELYNDDNFYLSYMDAISKIDKINGEHRESIKISEIEQRPNLTEGFYYILEAFYTKLKNTAKSDSLLMVEKQKFPNGVWKRRDLYPDFLKENNADKKAVMYDVFANLQSPNEDNLQFQGYLRKAISEAYEKEGNMEMALKWSINISLKEKMSDLNNKSWEMAKDGKKMQEAKRMSEEATMYAKLQLENPTDQKPKGQSIRVWKQERKITYAKYADTYAFILYQLREYKKGLIYSKVGVTFYKLRNVEYNERYALLLEKAAPSTEVKKVIEEMVILGTASAKTKEVLKTLYAREKKTEMDFDTYINMLETKAKEQKRAALAKSMINKPAPKFALKDWDGKEVSLESLKGKVVVVDFWATWCGPCIASMPGMKKAQEELAAREDIKFLFIDTKEHVDNILENAKEFMKLKGYSFYVLMDDDNKMANDFDVNGIPTKFILDKGGNIRFKSIGFDGNTDALADEVKEMVEMAGR